VYGNIYKDDLQYQFEHRFADYNIDEYCEGCEERYIGLIDDVNDIITKNVGDCFL
jgi:hypothetical protein